MAHIHDKIDFTTQALIVHEHKVLLRQHEKYHIWLGVGGHIELDEDPVQALHREVLEECGLEIEIIAEPLIRFEDGGIDLPTPHFMHRMFVGKNHEHIDLVYITRAKTLDIKPAEGELVTEFKWFSKDELADPQYKIQPRIQYFARKAIEMVDISKT